MAGTFKGRDDEERIQGRHACNAVFHKRRDDISRVFIASEEMRTHRGVLQWAKEARTLDRIIPREELDKVARSKHHEGIFFLVKAPRPWAAHEAVRVAKRRTIVVLENVKDPHNLGAIMRVCAHFDVGAVFCTEESATRSPAMFRTAQGAAEHVPMVYTDNETALTHLKRGDYNVLATSPHRAVPLYGEDIAAPPVAFVFGAEREGLSPFWLDNADRTITIPGSGYVESLNIACATSTVLGEAHRLRLVHAASFE